LKSICDLSHQKGLQEEAKNTEMRIHSATNSSDAGQLSSAKGALIDRPMGRFLAN